MPTDNSTPVKTGSSARHGCLDAAGHEHLAGPVAVPGDSTANARYNEARMYNTVWSRGLHGQSHGRSGCGFAGGSLPATHGDGCAGATLDINSATQTIGSLAGRQAAPWRSAPAR
jgi:hypothetical protein